MGSKSPSPSADQRAIAPLLQPEAWQRLNTLGHYEPDQELALNQQLRAEGFSADTVAALLNQWQLRAEAGSKFADFAQRMLFTRQGLEQATRLPVAAHHAQRFQQAGIRTVVDLGCGLAADALALATLGLEVHAVEADEAIAAAATVNLMPTPQATVHHQRAEDFVQQHQHWAERKALGWWFDPARRRVHHAGGAQKIFDPAAFTPPLSLVEQLVDAGAPVGVKLAPGMPHEALPESVHQRGEVQYISHRGQLVEVVLWFNALASGPTRRSALILGEGHSPQLFASATPLPQAATAPVAGPEFLQQLADEGGYLYEPDAALIRSRLVAEAVQACDGALFDEHIAYFGAAQAHTHPAWQCWRITEVLPYKIKLLRSWLKERSVTALTVKKRGLDVRPEELRRILLGPGNTKKSGTKKPQQVKAGKKKTGSATTAGHTSASGPEAGQHQVLVLTRIGQQRYAIAVEPLDPASS